jgi:hypothetical protein
MSSLFDDLSGEQLWHISAPDNVSIDAIKDLDIQAALRGESILEQNGVEYHMEPMVSAKDIVLLPQGTKSIYTQNTTRINKSFNLRQMSTRSNAQEQVSLVFTASKGGAKKVSRQQPKGLKMRYYPYGVTAIRQENNDMIEDALRVPDDVGETSRETTSAGTNAAAQVDHMDVDPKTPERKKKKKSKDEASGSTEKKKKKKKRLLDEVV